MDGEPVEDSAESVEELESDVYPLFVQAQLNCGQWVEPFNDYEPITDLLAMFTFLGVDSYGYDSTALLEHLLEQAATVEFAQNVGKLGCVKSLMLVFISYEGESEKEQ